MINRWCLHAIVLLHKLGLSLSGLITFNTHKSGHFILKEMTTAAGRLFRSHFRQNRYTAYLDDYAFLIHGLLNLFEATGEKWLVASQELQRH